MSLKLPFAIFLFIVSYFSTSTVNANTETNPNNVLNNYFQAVSQKNVDALLTIFDHNAVIVTSAGDIVGHEAITHFYRNGIFQCTQFNPDPGPRHTFSTNQIAVEINLVCDGVIRKVGDFFTFNNGKITRLAVYSGAGYSPARP